MGSQHIRVVVGEGRAQRAGLLRFVLEGEGFDVAAVATTAPALARHLNDDRPDVVVLDDGLGSTVVSMTRRMLPTVKIVLVWPRGLVALGGDASVEPSDVFRDLGRSVERVMGMTVPSAATTGRPRGIERRVHPSNGMMRGGPDRRRSSSGSGETMIDDRDPAPIVAFPGMPQPPSANEEIVVVPDVAEETAYWRDGDPGANLAAASRLGPPASRRGSSSLGRLWMALRPGSGKGER
ncbi:MAG: hypothetical protein M3P11_11920 [Actinomycetota bacterium]|nr:hypothetical protein [Actinomycetota bacterium]